MYQSGNIYLIEQLKFSDHLRDNKRDRLTYEQLKVKLVNTNRNNKYKYTEEKQFFSNQF